MLCLRKTSINELFHKQLEKERNKAIYHMTLFDRFKNISIQWKFILLQLLVTIIPVILFSFIFYRQSTERTTLEYLQRLNEKTARIQRSIETKMEVVSVLSKTISTNQPLRNYLQYYTTDVEMYLFNIIGLLWDIGQRLRHVTYNYWEYI
jgi:uncharacterized membrane protein YraQ (UPF0718 family)